MIDVTNGEVSTREGLVIGPNYSFDKFKTTKFYNGQDGVRIIYLDEHQTIYGRQFIMSLFFRDGIIYMVSLICCDEKFSESNERERKKIHDKILTEMGLLQGEKYQWGKIVSEYDVRWLYFRTFLEVKSNKSNYLHNHCRRQNFSVTDYYKLSQNSVEEFIG